MELRGRLSGHVKYYTVECSLSQPIPNWFLVLYTDKSISVLQIILHVVVVVFSIAEIRSPPISGCSLAIY